MIYTVTFNPSLDCYIKLDRFKYGDVNRMKSQRVVAGGKGINVSHTLAVLGRESVAMGFAAGFSGKQIVHSLECSGIEHDFIMLEEDISRINVKIKTELETEINGTGPVIEKENIAELNAKLSDLLQEGDILVLAGSVPPSVKENVYSEILGNISRKAVLSVVDASGKLLKNTLKHKPFLIKPNIDELRELFDDADINDKKTVAKYAALLREAGAKNVLVSMAQKGAVLVTEHGDVLKSSVTKGTMVNSVGAGDSMVAGFISGYLETKDYAYALRCATACGTASAFAKTTLIKHDIEKIMFNVKIT